MANPGNTRKMLLRLPTESNNEASTKRIRDIRQLLDQAGHAVQRGPHRLASLDDLYSLAATEGITVPPEIKTAC